MFYCRRDPKSLPINSQELMDFAGSSWKRRDESGIHKKPLESTGSAWKQPWPVRTFHQKPTLDHSKEDAWKIIADAHPLLFLQQVEAKFYKRRFFWLIRGDSIIKPKIAESLVPPSANPFHQSPQPFSHPAQI